MSGSPAQYSGWECRDIDISQAHDPMGRDLELLKLKLELELDKDGSLVSIEPRGWYIRVVPGRVKHWRHPFVHQRHKHVFAMRPVGPAQWPLFDPWWYRLLTATITSEQTRKVLTWDARQRATRARSRSATRQPRARLDVVHGACLLPPGPQVLGGSRLAGHRSLRGMHAERAQTPARGAEAGPHEMRPAPRAWKGTARTRVCGQFRHDQETIGTDTTYRPARRAWNRAAACAAVRLCGSAAAVQRRLPVQG